jgi:hypothetical protein
MPTFKQCEFFLLRYVPDAVKDEFVNIGVVLIEQGANGPAFADLRFTKDWSRVRCLDPLADLEMLIAVEGELRRELKNTAEREAILARLRGSLSNALQFSSTKACLTEDPAEELQHLARTYLESRTVPRERAMGARSRIVIAMREAFEQAGVWGLMWKKVPAAQYSFRADPFKFDCGYKPNGIVRLFHGVALATDLDAAKSLAYTFPQVREGIYREHRAKAELTAVVESLDAGSEEARFAAGVLRDTEIAIAPVSDLPRLAERARVELKV